VRVLIVLMSFDVQAALTVYGESGYAGRQG
jgi:hypothetical protein